MHLTFLKSAVAESGWPDAGLPEVGFFGRSNAGKSSLINAIGRVRVARVSREPGRTRTLNFYVGDGVMLVDLPGYGYARMSQADAQRQAEILQLYIGRRTPLAGVVQLVDIRHAPSALDIEWHARLRESGVPFLLLLGKADQVSRGASASRRREILDMLSSDVTAAAFSARSGEGVQAVLTFLHKARTPS